jgi:transcriptional regulator with GAF, ATPase, and Fis domain
MVISSVELPEDLIQENNELSESPELRSIAEVDKEHIVAALKKCNGKVSGKGGAAEMLAINPNTLTSRMKKLGIVWQYILK